MSAHDEEVMKVSFSLAERLRAGFLSEVPLSRYIELEAADVIDRLQTEVQRLQFQPNHRKLTRDIIRSLILKVRTLQLELKQRDPQAGR